MDEMAPSFYTEQERAVVGKLFPTCEKISIDYAVMEKSKEIYTLPAEFGWSDLGSWGSLRTLLPHNFFLDRNPLNCDRKKERGIVLLSIPLPEALAIAYCC